MVEDGTGGIASQTVSFNIAADADTPEFGITDVTIDDADAREFTLDLSAMLVDLDSSESLAIEATSVPTEVQLSTTLITDGNSDGVINSSIMVTPNQGFEDAFSFTLTATATEGSNNDMASTSIEVHVGTNPGETDDEVLLTSPITNGVRLTHLPIDNGSIGGTETTLGDIDFTTTTGDTVIGIGDVDGDSSDDVLLSFISGSNATLTYIPIINGVLGTEMPLGIIDFNTIDGQEIIGIGDANGDGDDDVLLALTVGSVAIMTYMPINNGSLGAEVTLGIIDFNTTTGDMVIGIGDVNNSAQSGNDNFVSTSASEAFIGLGGEDVFAFSLAGDIGQDLIGDLVLSEDTLHFVDVIDVGASGLTVEDLDAANHTFGADGQGNLEIEFENGGSLTLIDVSAAGIDSFADLAAIINIEVFS